MRATGLEGFMQLAAKDQENEWDSDESEEGEDTFEAGRRAAQENRNGGDGRRGDKGAREVVM